MTVAKGFSEQDPWLLSSSGLVWSSCYLGTTFSMFMRRRLGSLRGRLVQRPHVDDGRGTRYDRITDEV